MAASSEIQAQASDQWKKLPWGLKLFGPGAPSICSSAAQKAFHYLRADLERNTVRPVSYHTTPTRPSSYHKDPAQPGSYHTPDGSYQTTPVRPGSYQTTPARPGSYHKDPSPARQPS